MQSAQLIQYFPGPVGNVEDKKCKFYDGNMVVFVVIKVMLYLNMVFKYLTVTWKRIMK